jgi:hypothetical protein
MIPGKEKAKGRAREKATDGGLLRRVLKPGGIYCQENWYPSRYQNLITKHILPHPATNRFRSPDLKRQIQAAGLGLDHLLQCTRVRILGISIQQSGT